MRAPNCNRLVRWSQSRVIVPPTSAPRRQPITKPVDAAVLIVVALTVIAEPLSDNVPTKFVVPLTVKLSATVVSDVV